MPYDIDREFVTLFTVMNENEGWYLESNLKRFATAENGTTIDQDYIDNFNFDDEDFQESNLMHSMNGWEWDALGPYMTGIYKGERIRWYIGGMGTEVDIHSAHWHGNIVKRDGFVYEDVVQLMPAYTTTVDMYADNPGKWFYHCHVNDHVEAGMIATYTVMNESCIDCVGKSLDDISDADVSSKNDDHESFVDVLQDHSTWFIVAISFVVNWCGLLMVYVVYRMCCNKGRKRGLNRSYDIGGSRMNSLRESMLEMGH